MHVEQVLSYLFASFIIIVVPGPNILLIVNDSITYGFKKSMLTALGITSGMALLFSLSLTGVATMLILFSWLFSVIKWIGVCYLFYLGLSQIVASFKPNLWVNNQNKGKRSFFTKGFLIAATNPKGLIFAGAFFPQFLNQNIDMVSQITILCGGFLLLSLIIGFLYALCCDSAGKLFKSNSLKKQTNRISGICLICFGVGLAFANVVPFFNGSHSE